MHDESDLTIYDKPPLKAPRLVFGLSGWMDAGDVSTGAIEFLNESLKARPFAEIDPEDFYLYAAPEGLEDDPLLRPLSVIEGGLLEDFEEPLARFTHDLSRNIILFTAREPNCQWRRFSECLFQITAQFNVEEIFFVGSITGSVPHTRRPRFFGAANEPDLLQRLDALGLRPVNYEGPASFATYLMREAALRHIPMLSIVAEIPAYVEGRNARCIEATIKKLEKALNVDVDVSPLQQQAESFERKLNRMVERREDLTAVVRRMESEYDRIATDAQMDHLRDWFKRQGMRQD